MPEVSNRQITRLLRDWSNGDARAREALASLVYEELRYLARSCMRKERVGHTLQPTALVHEAYVRLVDQRMEWKSRSQFFAIAASMMRRILVDHAKQRNTAKRGSGAYKVELEDALAISKQAPSHLIALNDALDDLAREDPQRSQIVELRYFGGLSNEESAKVLGISTATVQRQWVGARAWLFHELDRGEKNE